jgi:hypothetical protein
MEKSVGRLAVLKLPRMRKENGAATKIKTVKNRPYGQRD